MMQLLDDNGKHVVVSYYIPIINFQKHFRCQLCSWVVEYLLNMFNVLGLTSSTNLE